MKLNYLYDLGGDDHRIVAHCEPAVRNKFLAIGASIPLIYLLCMISSLYTFSQVFNNVLLNIILSFFLSWMITNIYRLLLCTSSKNPLPQAYQPKSVVLSMSIRVLFVWFIALMISKPIESMLFYSELDQDIALYKSELKQKNTDSLTRYYKIQLDEMSKLSLNATYTRNFRKEKEAALHNVIQQMNGLIDASGFYLQRIRFLNTRHVSCWLLTACFIALLSCPVYLKRTLHACSYYDLKGEADRWIIEEAYLEFKERYSTLFLEKHNKTLKFSEPYEDAPYNTVRKKDKRSFYSQEQLLAELYNA